jgi:hypothetical protein
MKRKLFVTDLSGKLLFTLWLILTFAALSIEGMSQVNVISSPAEEIFKPDDDFIGDATGLGKRTVYDASPQDTIHIYNADGSIWYEFSVYKNSSLYYRNNPKSDFQPFVFPGYGPASFRFRIKASSDHWYEIIVNEETQVSKYVSKNDPILGRWSFEKILLNLGDNKVEFNFKENPLRKAPDGDIINIDISDKDIFDATRLNGDWLEVKLSKGNQIGWIRWRQNRKILIRFSLNFVNIEK